MDREALGRELIRLGTALRLGTGPTYTDDQLTILAAALKPYEPRPTSHVHFPRIDKIEEHWDGTDIKNIRFFLHVAIEDDPEFHVPF